MKDLSSLNDIFKNSIFRIPNYQRGYSWEFEQLEEFWDDVFNLPDNNEHYTGMLSLKELTLSNNKEELEKWIDAEWLLNKDYHAYHVVDGQQRLTTLIILIQAIVEYCREKNPGKKDDEIIMNDTKLSEIIDQFIVKEKPGSDSLIKTYLFGYEVDKPSDDYLKNKILNPYYNGEINESFYTLNLDNAKRFFIDKLAGISSTDDNLPIEKIFRKITNKLKFNIYYISDDFNVNVAFETMNNRGKRLSNLELLKNRLIYLTSLLTLPKDEEKTMISKINDTWKKIYSYLGKNKNETLPDDDFLIAHSYIYFGYIQDIKKGYSQFLLKKYFNQSRIFNGLIYETFKENSSDDEQDFIEEDSDYIIDLSDKLTKKDILEYISSLDSLIPFWYELHFSDYANNDNINNWLTKLKRLEYNYFKPLVLVCLSKNEIADNKKLGLIKAVERFIFITFRLCGYQATYNRNNVYNYTHQLYKNEIDIDQVIEKISKLEVLSSNNVLQFSSISSTITRLFKREGFYSWKANRYFLYEYETNLVEKYSGTTKITDNYFLPPSSTEKLSIEHIFPQSESSEYWLKVFCDYSLEERNALRGSLGNLLPLSLDINRDLQDYDFNTKKKRYENGSYSEQEIFKEEVWNSDRIMNRGLILVNFMEQRWNFKLVSDSDRKSLLGLSFMINDDDEYNNYTEIVNVSSNKKEVEIFPDLDELLFLNISGETYAKGYFRNGGILVLKDSRLRKNINPGSDSMKAKIQKERANSKIINDVYISEVFYESPSLAANTILGNHKNGWVAWKNEVGTTLDELVGRSKNNFDRLLKNASIETKETFEVLNKRILEINEDIECFTTNEYIGYKIDKNFLELHVNKNNLLCYTVNGDLYKTNELLKHVPESYGWHVDTKFYIESKDDIDKLWYVILDSYEKTNR